MSDIMTEDQLSVPYNPNLLVTYKAIPGTLYSSNQSQPATYKTDKVTDLEWELHNGRENSILVQENRNLINTLEEQITEWYDPNYSKEDVLLALAEHFGINPIKQIEVQGTISFSGTINVPVSEVADFDLSNVTIDVDLSSYEYDADLNVDDVSLEESY